MVVSQERTSQHTTVGVPRLPLLVETRFRVPAPLPGAVSRDGVWSSLERFADRRVTLVAAPTGYGKTTALAAWSRTRAHPVAWLSFEPADDRPVRFATYLISALHRAVPSVGAAALAALQNPYTDIESDVIGSVVNDVAGQDERIVLVLDDVHSVGDPACLDILGLLVAQMPAQLRLVLSTRVDPSLPLARLRAIGELGEIRVDELRFTRDEIDAFVAERLPGRLDRDAIATLGDQTEGWPAGLNLAVLSLTGRGGSRSFDSTDAATQRHVVDYLMSEIVDHQPPETRDFLLRTSVLDRMTGDLCDALTGESDGASRLVALERANLFVSGFDKADGWFRYHRLLREALRAELAVERPGLDAELRIAASRWHEADCSYDEAVRYALAAGDHALAGTILARHYLAFTRGGHLAELRELTAALDTDRLATSGGAVAFVAALEAGLSGEAGGVVEAQVSRMVAHGLDAVRPEGIPSTEAGALFIRAAFLYGDVGRTRKAAAVLRDRWPDHMYLGGLGHSAHGYTSYLLGDGEGARRDLAKVAPQIDARRPLISIHAVSTYALVALQAGRTAAGIHAAEAAHDTAVRMGLRDAVAMAIAHEAFGAAMLAEGRTADALQAVERAAQLVRPAQSLPRAAILLTLATARFADGDSAGAAASLGEARGLIVASRDPGALPARLRTTARRLGLDAVLGADSHSPTRAELRVLRLLPSVLSQREIAQELYLAPDTVKTHLRNLYRKLDARSRSEAIERAREAGLL